MDLLERHYPTQLPSNSNEATFSDGFGMLGMFDILSAQGEDGTTSISYSFQNPRKVPQEILVPYEPTIPLMPPNESYVPGMTLTITDAFTRQATPNVCPQFANFCKDHSSLVFGFLADQHPLKNSMNSKTKIAIMASLENAIFLGCPQDLVMEELHRELEFQGTERHTNHLFHGGHLSYIPFSTSNVAGVLLYPSGAAMDILTVTTFCPIYDGLHVRLSPKPENKIERFQLSGTIRQIESFAYPRSGGGYSIVRTDYTCLLLKVSLTDDGNTTNVEMIDIMETHQRITSVALSPFISTEYMYAREKRKGKKIVLSDSTGVLHSWKEFPGAECKTDPLFCHFGAHPREAFVHDQKQAVLYDFRSPPHTYKKIFELPDPCLPVDQCFCVARQHPSNHFYHYLATQDALMLLDQRFPQHAVLQTYHNVKGMPSYLEISSYNKTENSIVMVGNHIEKQVHCYFVKDKTESVPILYSLPWKVTPFYDWVEVIDGMSKCGNPKIWERLDEPLMGFAACQVSVEDRNSWNVIQISGAGDLFCQTFIPPDPEASPEDQIKNKNSLHLCEMWLKAASGGTEGQVYPKDDSKGGAEIKNTSLTTKSKPVRMAASKSYESDLKSIEKNLFGEYEDSSDDEAEIRDPTFILRSKRGGSAAPKGLKGDLKSRPQELFGQERCRTRSRVEYHSPCSRCSNVECLFGTKEGHGLKRSASKFRKNVVELDPDLLLERSKKLYDEWNPLVCEKCCADCVADVESYGNIRVKMKGFLKCLKLPWQDDLEEVKTFEKRKKELLENELMSQKTTPVKQSPSHTASTSMVELDIDGRDTSLVVKEEVSEMPLSQCSQVTLFSQDNDDYKIEEIDEDFGLDWRRMPVPKKIQRFSQPESMGF
ncbi:TATA box-binding protein-associated factor, RNA polymerase I, subunit C [Holothuria leucospilota]|uniref:TATA box-binding protein-associated factor, RNA polymerase I, subunit C n=1 Tax=Holothuria leucospilota TaxID=206669 RepID=A0A9Q1BMT7_HOLLE|nr:TATA box-binding protein-associated factor, RNA polymerase I, subunit C [Holothuria leucospilota]